MSSNCFRSSMGSKTLGVDTPLKKRGVTPPRNGILKGLSQWWQTVGLSNFHLEGSNVDSKHISIARRAYEHVTKCINRRAEKLNAVLKRSLEKYQDLPTLPDAAIDFQQKAHNTEVSSGEVEAGDAERPLHVGKIGDTDGDIFRTPPFERSGAEMLSTKGGMENVRDDISQAQQFNRESLRGAEDGCICSCSVVEKDHLAVNRIERKVPLSSGSCLCRAPCKSERGLQDIAKCGRSINQPHAMKRLEGVPPRQGFLSQPDNLMSPEPRSKLYNMASFIIPEFQQYPPPQPKPLPLIPQYRTRLRSLARENSNGRSAPGVHKSPYDEHTLKGLQRLKEIHRAVKRQLELDIKRECNASETPNSAKRRRVDGYFSLLEAQDELNEKISPARYAFLRATTYSKIRAGIPLSEALPKDRPIYIAYGVGLRRPRKASKLCEDDSPKKESDKSDAR